MQAVAKELNISPREMEVVNGKADPKSADSADLSDSSASSLRTSADYADESTDAAAVKAEEDSAYSKQNEEVLQKDAVLERFTDLDSRLQ